MKNKRTNEIGLKIAKYLKIINTFLRILWNFQTRININIQVRSLVKNWKKRKLGLIFFRNFFF
jgi:hypothetical protein